MRLWHEKLIVELPRQQLLGQHRECCALRGKGWKKPHATVNYVFNYPPRRLFNYHQLIMNEMKKRGYNISADWLDPFYRGKKSEPWAVDELGDHTEQQPIYPQHDEAYLEECLLNLKQKGIDIHFSAGTES